MKVREGLGRVTSGAPPLPPPLFQKDPGDDWDSCVSARSCFKNNIFHVDFSKRHTPSMATIHRVDENQKQNK